MRARKRIRLSQTHFQSALTTGRDIIAEVDGRSAIARRFRDVVALHTNDLGGADHLSEGQHSIIRRIATLTVQLELLETKFAQHGGPASAKDFELYQRASNTMRRHLDSLGLSRGRKARPVNEPHSLDDYIRQRSNGHRSNGRVRIIEHEADA